MPVGAVAGANLLRQGHEVNRLALTHQPALFGAGRVEQFEDEGLEAVCLLLQLAEAREVRRGFGVAHGLAL